MFALQFLSNPAFLAVPVIPAEPGAIIGPISWVLGYVMEFLYNFVDFFINRGTFGVAIILFTIVIRIIMIPLAVKQQQSMVRMQSLQPEIEKIKKKYAKDTSQEAKQKMNVEIQKMYSEKKINPLGGCLPLLIQMPVFIALNTITQSGYRYVTKIHDLFSQIGTLMLSNFDLRADGKAYSDFFSTLLSQVAQMLPKNSENFSLVDPSSLMRVINKLDNTQWDMLMKTLSPENQAAFQPLLEMKHNIHYFFGINLGQNCMAEGIFPGVIIPILAVVTTFLSTYFINKMTVATDPSMKQQQKIMMYTMPVVMGFMTINLNAGVGVYWITSSIFQTVQQMILNKYYRKSGPTHHKDESKETKVSSKKDKKSK